MYLLIHIYVLGNPRDIVGTWMHRTHSLHALTLEYDGEQKPLQYSGLEAMRQRCTEVQMGRT